MPDKINLASQIDHTNLKPTATTGEIGALCAEALEYHFASVCVNPCHTTTAKKALQGSDVKVAVAIGFPLGATTTPAKAFEAREATLNGADELDMVINIGALKEGHDSFVEGDIRAVVEAAGQAVVKVIVETCYLTDDEIVRACRLAVRAGAGFVKTSTGFGPAGAKVEHVRLMRAAVGPEIGVKAAGGIRTYQDAIDMIEAGANRIGTSAGISIIYPLCPRLIGGG